MKIPRQASCVSVWQGERLLIAQLRVAWGFWERGVGLMFRRGVPPRCGAGILFPQARDLHTFAMRFALDVVWVDGQGSVVAIRRGIRPCRFVKGPGTAKHVFEVAAGDLPDLAEGTIRFEPVTRTLSHDKQDASPSLL